MNEPCCSMEIVGGVAVRWDPVFGWMGFEGSRKVPGLGRERVRERPAPAAATRGQGIGKDSGYSTD